ncbi:hypothetical protein HDU98_006859 [Podochytrium sp. JEL0797]|nr:hypothetical protein HDU98_006859 [Podochytrium sp. JEL0797]
MSRPTPRLSNGPSFPLALHSHPSETAAADPAQDLSLRPMPSTALATTAYSPASPATPRDNNNPLPTHEPHPNPASTHPDPEPARVPAPATPLASFFRLRRGTTLPVTLDPSSLAKPQTLKEKSKRLLILLEPFDAHHSTTSQQLESTRQNTDKSSPLTTTRVATSPFSESNHNHDHSTMEMTRYTDTDPFHTSHATAKKHDDVVIVTHPGGSLTASPSPLFEEPESFLDYPKTASTTCQISSPTDSAACLESCYMCPVCWEARSSRELVVIGECARE